MLVRLSGVATAKVGAALDMYAVHATTLARGADRRALAGPVNTQHRRLDAGEFRAHVAAAQIRAGNLIRDTHDEVRVRLDAEQTHG
jgi:hypothetical protein